MKKYIIILLLSIISQFAFGQNNNDAITKYFHQYENNEAFTSVYISPKMFQMISKLDLKSNDAGSKEMLSVLSDLKGLKILTTEKNGFQYYNEFIKKINVNEYEVLMTVKDKGENVRFFTKDNGNIINELLLVIGGKDEFVLLSFIGNIDLQKISKLSKNLNISGAEYLEKVGKKE